MKIKILLIILSALFFAMTQYQVEANSLNIVINEILPDPDGSDSGKEWIEFKNLSSESINLKGYRLQNVNLDSGSIRNISITTDLIVPSSLFAVIQEAQIVDTSIPNLILGNGKLNLYNTKAKLILYDQNNAIVHEFVYLEVKSGKSVESPGFPFCVKNLVNNLGNTLGYENAGVLKLCSETLEGHFEFSNDSENFSNYVDSFSKSMFLKFVPNEIIGDLAVQFYDNGQEIILPKEVTTETTVVLVAKVTSTMTNLEYDFETTFVLGKEQPVILFSLDNTNWNEQLNSKVKAGTLLYFKENNNLPVELVYKENKFVSPFKVTETLTSVEFQINSERLQTNALSLKVLPELEITVIYPAPKTGEKEYLKLRNASDYLFEGEIFLTDSIDNPTQKKISLLVNPREDLQVFEVPSLNNSGDEVYLFFEDTLIDHIVYSTSFAGDLLLRESKNDLPVGMSKPQEAFLVQSITTIKSNEKGSKAKLRGKVTYKYQDILYLQDETDGIKITGNLDNLELGSFYEVTGLLSESNGEKKLTGVNLGIETQPFDILEDWKLDQSLISEHIGQIVFGETTILANYAKSFKILENVSISLTGFDGFDRTKGDAIRFKGVLTKYGASDYRILPLDLQQIIGSSEDEIISFPKSDFLTEKTLEETIAEIRANGINSLFLAVAGLFLYFFYKFFKAKTEIIVLKFSLWIESRKITQSHSSEKNSKSDTANATS